MLRQGIQIKFVVIVAILVGSLLLPFSRELTHFLVFPLLLLSLIAVLKDQLGKSMWVISGGLLALWSLSFLTESLPVADDAIVISPDKSRERAYRLSALLEGLRSTKSFPKTEIDLVGASYSGLLRISAEKEWLKVSTADKLEILDEFNLFLRPTSYVHKMEPEEITKHYFAAFSKGLSSLQKSKTRTAAREFERAASFPGHWSSGASRGAAWYMASVSELEKSSPDYELAYGFLKRAASSFSMLENPSLYGRIMSNASLLHYKLNGNLDKAIEMSLKAYNASKDELIKSNLVKLVEQKNKNTSS